MWLSSGEGTSLERCVGPVPAFLSEVWSRRPLLRRRNGDDDYSDLLSLDDVDRLVATGCLRPPAFRLLRDGAAIPVSNYTRSGTLGGRVLDDLPDVGRVHDLFADGATIVLQGLHRYWEPLTRFCRDLELTLTHPCQANAYVTPPGSTGLKVHHDTHDVIVLQTHGRKHWVVHEPAVDLPLTSQRWVHDEHVPGEPLLDVVLQPGDCLYLPRGVPHAARSVEDASVHVTVGIRARTWYDVLAAAVEEARDVRAFRESLPAGFARDPDSFAVAVATRLKEMAGWLESVDAAAVGGRVGRRFWRGLQPDLDGHLADLLALEDIDDTTVVRRRPATAHLLTVADGRLEVELGDRCLRMPAELAAVVALLLDGDPHRVGDLEALDADSRRVLVRRLVREGALAIARG